MDKRRVILLIAGLMILGGLAGCDRGAAVNNPQVAVIDLAKVAEAAGYQQQISDKMHEYQQELRGNLSEMETELQQQLAAQQAELGSDPNPQQAQAFQEMVVDAQRRLQRAGSDAQQAIQQRQKELMTEFLSQIRPLTTEVAKDRGILLIVVKGEHIVSYAQEIDITEAVIAKLKGQKEKKGPLRDDESGSQAAEE